MARKMSDPNCRRQESKTNEIQWSFLNWSGEKVSQIQKMEGQCFVKMGEKRYHYSKFSKFTQSCKVLGDQHVGVTVSWCVSKLGTMKCIVFLLRLVMYHNVQLFFVCGVLNFEKFSYRSLEYSHQNPLWNGHIWHLRTQASITQQAALLATGQHGAFCIRLTLVQWWVDQNCVTFLRPIFIEILYLL